MLATGFVVTVKVAVVWVAATVTLAGTAATGTLLLVSITTAPPVGAGPPRVTVPVEEVPPVTEVGFRLIELSTEGPTVKSAVFVMLLYRAEIVTGVLDVTATVVTVNVAVVSFAATVTLAGTVATGVLLLTSVTSAPPDGAGPLSVTVPVDVVPPATAVGFTPTELSTGGTTVKLAVCVELL